MDTRLAALRRFAIAITVLNILGHSFLGFEQSPAQPVFSVLLAWSIELVLETVQSWGDGRKPRFLGGGIVGFVDFLLPAQITGLAVAMLLYANDRLLPILFATTIAMCSKAIFTIKQGPAIRHFFNPSNFGITLTLLLFPSVGITPPYMFTEGLGVAGSLILPLFITVSGTYINTKLTGRLPLLLAWISGFTLQALVRHYLFGTSLLPMLGVMTGVTFVLYTFYMITDPATTPAAVRGQVAFGLSVGLLYGVLVMSHIVFGMFFALTIVCFSRGMALLLLPLLEKAKSPAREEQRVLAAVR
ncbi:MAG: enediyne biosynthesis protein UnbU [Candidatus Korobacteraceae bacterium]